MGASLTARDRNHGGAPLDWAVHGSVHGWHPGQGDYPATVTELLRGGAPPPAPFERIRPSAAVLDALRGDAPRNR